MSSNLDLPSSESPIAAGWNIRMIKDRHDVAHLLFSAAWAVARAQNDSRSAGTALLALSDNLMWYCPPEIAASGVSAEQFWNEALTFFRAAGDESGVAAALREMGKCEESLEICRRIDDRIGIVQSLERVAVLAASRGEIARARSLLDEALMLARQSGNSRLLASILQSIGARVHDDADYRNSALLEAAELYGRLKYNRSRARVLEMLAAVGSE